MLKSTLLTRFLTPHGSLVPLAVAATHIRHPVVLTLADVAGAAPAFVPAAPIAFLGGGSSAPVDALLGGAASPEDDALLDKVQLIAILTSTIAAALLLALLAALCCVWRLRVRAAVARAKADSVQGTEHKELLALFANPRLPIEARMPY